MIALVGTRIGPTRSEHLVQLFQTHIVTDVASTLRPPHDGTRDGRFIVNQILGASTASPITGPAQLETEELTGARADEVAIARGADPRIGPTSERLVRTDPEVGLTERHVTEAIRILSA